MAGDHAEMSCRRFDSVGRFPRDGKIIAKRSNIGSLFCHCNHNATALQSAAIWFLRARIPARNQRMDHRHHHPQYCYHPALAPPPPALPVSLNINELNLEQIYPNSINFENKDQGGSKIVVIGKPGTGKTTLITDLLYHKKHIFPIGLVVSGTEDSNGHYSQIFPSNFVHNKLYNNLIQNFIDRQKLSKKYLANPWSILILDDCTDNPKLFNDPLYQGIFKKKH